MINDNFLNEVAKAIASESYVVPAYLVWGSTAISESTSSTSLSGEFSTRAATSDNRSGALTVFTAIKSGALVGSSGETLRAIALNNSSSSGTHLSEKLLSSILQTTAFDIQVVWNINVERL